VLARGRHAADAEPRADERRLRPHRHRLRHRLGARRGAIAQYWHKNQFGQIAGRLYIAWCAAAVGLPVLAGALFDRTGSYASTVWVAAGINVLGMLVAGRLPGR
jgi:hypothetical protein